jgi:hypothetical protein
MSQTRGKPREASGSLEWGKPDPGAHPAVAGPQRGLTARFAKAKCNRCDGVSLVPLREPV